ncbi:kinase-like protein [Cylindrobasidium torrendii FP15055 ss-10]|uniref:non-specific serine/threonine protein kinase n=1 Tax=Cylindrobasidium torrendii FP15055 ss-10 TaxID=1314674 RepID=A0A0D7BI85_9AGAR|nr:kinase-like protein [Cylindrobasidium torrendii FP15055 ss-10]
MAATFDSAQRRRSRGRMPPLILTRSKSASGSTIASYSSSSGPLTPCDEDDISFFNNPTLDDSYISIPPLAAQKNIAMDDHSLSYSMADTSSVVEPTILPPSISSFDIVGTLGRGPYGKVLLAKQRSSQDLCAVRVLKKHGISQYGAEEIERELRTLRRVAVDSGHNEDPGAAFVHKFYSTFSDDAFSFLVLQHHPATLASTEIAASLRLDGSSQSSQSSDAAQRVRLVAAELVLAVLFLHGRGILHQDIKPANIMVSETGHIVLGDFGASSWMNKDGKVFFGATDVVAFTPLYAAPELVYRDCAGHGGRVVIDSSVDWWSLGVVLFELTTGETPFPHRGSRRAMGDFSCSFGALETITEAGQGMGVQLKALIRDLLVYEPSERLHDGTVKAHSFFSDYSADSWRDIGLLKHAPLVPPSLAQVDQDAALPFKDELAASPEIFVHPSPPPSPPLATSTPPPRRTKPLHSRAKFDTLSPKTSRPMSEHIQSRLAPSPVIRRTKERARPIPSSPSSLPFPTVDKDGSMTSRYRAPASPLRNVYVSMESSESPTARRKAVKASRRVGLECDEFGVARPTGSMTMEDNLTLSMLTAMGRSRKVSRSDSTSSKKSVVGKVFTRLRHLSMSVRTRRFSSTIS